MSSFDQTWAEYMREQMAGGFVPGGDTGGESEIEWRCAAAGRPRTPERQALAGGFAASISAEGWKLEAVKGRGGVVEFTWKRGTAEVRGRIRPTDRQAAFGQICRELARHLGLTAFEKSFAQLFP